MYNEQGILFPYLHARTWCEEYALQYSLFDFVNAFDINGIYGTEIKTIIWYALSFENLTYMSNINKLYVQEFLPVAL